MRTRWMRLLVALVFVLASMTATMAQSPTLEESLTTSVEIPGAGAVVTLPRAWRTWQNEAYDSARRQGPGVWTTDVDTGWTCQLWSSEDLVSAEVAADSLVGAPEAADIGISRSEADEVPVGTAVLVTFGGPEGLQPPDSIEHVAYVDAPHAVVQVWCAGASAEHVRDLAMDIAPLAPEHVPEPFDPRIELAKHGFAVDFGPEWAVWFRFPGSLLGGTTVLTAQIQGPSGPSQSCHVEDVSAVPRFQRLTTADDWKRAFMKAADGRNGRELTTRAARLSSGPAIRALWDKYLAGEPTIAWVLSDDDRVIVLMCHSRRTQRPSRAASRPWVLPWSSPLGATRWRSIANTIEFLPAAE